jgi:pimeloyl-ACP methyl ester carboxylesterase
MRRPLIALVTVTFVTLAACGGSNGSGDGETSTDPRATPHPGSNGVPRMDTTDTFGWVEFGEDDDDEMGTVETGSIQVPIDPDDPSAGSFDLFIARHLATDPDARIGSLLVNPGGPGFGGSDFGIYAAQNFSSDLLAHFDIVGWDPRGTGLSTPAIDCVDDYDRYFATADITPDDAAERQQVVDIASEFAQACTQKNADIIDFVGTNDSARDIDVIRQALQEPTITYFGFSYGSELGATWATLFPDTVRAAVLDGALDPNADLRSAALNQAAGFEQQLDTFLAQCSDDDQCAFHNNGDSEAAFDDLMASVDAQPVPTESGRPAVNLLVATTAVTEAMYSNALWPELAQALADAQQGEGAGLLSLYDRYLLRNADGTYPNTLEAFPTIFCMDRVERPTVAEDDAESAAVRAVSPRLAPGTTGSYMCSFFPPSTNPRVPITGAGAGPILVVGTTGDAATPLASTAAMADALEDGVLLTVVGDQHTGYGVNDCSIATIDAYLVERTVPAAGTRCE